MVARRNVLYVQDVLSVKFCGGDIMMKCCFSGVGLGPLVPVKGTLNASAQPDILDNSTLPTLRQQFRGGPSPVST